MTHFKARDSRRQSDTPEVSQVPEPRTVVHRSGAAPAISGEYELELPLTGCRAVARERGEAGGRTGGGGADAKLGRASDSGASSETDARGPPTVRYHPQRSGEYRSAWQRREAPDGGSTSPPVGPASAAPQPHETLQQRRLAAQGWLARLEPSDRRRGILEVAVLRRDSGLLGAILASLEADSDG